MTCFIRLSDGKRRLQLARLILFVHFCVLASVSSAVAGTELSFIYSSHETHRSEQEEHHISKTLQFDVGALAIYHYTDWVRGTMAEGATSTRLYRSAVDNLSPARIDQLAQQIRQLRLEQLESDPRPQEPTGYEEIFDISNELEEFYLEFYKPTSDERVGRLRSLLLEVATELGIDKPEDPEKTVIRSEGDLVPTRKVPMSELIRLHDYYNGKRVSIVGFYNGKYTDGQEIFADEEAAKNHDVDKSVWRGRAASLRGQIPEWNKSSVWVRVDGVFLWGNYGHRGWLMGMIDRITDLQIVPAPPK